MPYMGNTTRKASDIRRFDVTSSTSATHTLTWIAPNEQSLIVTINGVKQHEDSYSVSGGVTLTLTSALIATDKLEVIGINDIGTTITPAQNSVDTDKIADDAVTSAKIADGTIVNADVNASAAIALSKLATDPSNASNLASGTVPTARLGSGTADATTFLRGDQTYAAPSSLFSSYAIIADQKAQNTPGGTFTAGAWRTRDLQTEVADPDGIVSISANAFTLGAGTYLIKWHCPNYHTNDTQSRLYNSTDASEAAIGWTIEGYYSSNSGGSGRVTIAGSKAFTIEHRCSTTTATYGFGTASNYGIEQFTTVEIYKEA